MPNNIFPDNLNTLHNEEQSHRNEAMKIIHNTPKLLPHLNVIERTMSLARVIVDHPMDDQDFRVIKVLSIRVFNAFGASLNLMLCGYHQKSAMVMRDVMETSFLMDLFSSDYSAIERWRFADDKKRKKEFSPAAVRKALDKRDGFKERKREDTYKMLSELASHPTMGTQYMLKSELDGDIMTGPFMGKTILRHSLEELGRLAVQAGEILDAFLPNGYEPEDVRASSLHAGETWVETFYR